MADIVTAIQIGPADAGRRLTLPEFADAEFEPGYLYELARGVVVVAELPSIFHAYVLVAIRNAFIRHQTATPGRIFMVLGGAESGVDLPHDNTRRHPDVSVYLAPPPTADAQPWDTWIPEIAVEVVSASSRERDYDEKPGDYLRAGVRLYWIVDPQTRTAAVLTRRGDTWGRATIDEAGVLSTGLLPELELKLSDVFAAVPRT